MSHAGERGRGPVHPRAGDLRRRLPLPGWVVVAALVVSSCSLFSGLNTGPEGRSTHDTELRRFARDEEFVKALDLTDPEDRGDIGDELLRLMHRGLLLHYAGEYEASNEVLQRAEEITDDRFTKSVSKAALSMVSSDRVLAWVPNDTERLMINYYGALNYLAQGDVEGAAVEARRLSRLLELSEEEELRPAELEVRRALRYFVGSVFEVAGDRNNAAVAYRHVWSPAEVPPDDDPLRPRFLQLYGDAPPRPSDRLPPEVGSDSAIEFVGPPAPTVDSGGDVVVIVEWGFVAHRVERSLNIPLFPGESNAFRASDRSVRRAAATCIAARAFDDRYDFATLSPDWNTGWRRGANGRCIVSGSPHRKRQDDDDEDEPSFYLMRVAWPEMVPSGLPGDLTVAGLGIAAGPIPLRVASASDDPVPPDLVVAPGAEEGATPGVSSPAPLARRQMSASLSDAAVAEFQDQLGGILVKAVARSAVKYGLARGVEKEVKKKDKILGEIAFLTANAAAALLERADTRCWHLLPDQFSVFRLRLPVGRYPLSVRVETARSGYRTIDLGEVEVHAGAVRVVSTRIWP